MAIIASIDQGVTVNSPVAAFVLLLPSPFSWSFVLSVRHVVLLLHDLLTVGVGAEVRDEAATPRQVGETPAPGARSLSLRRDRQLQGRLRRSGSVAVEPLSAVRSQPCVADHVCALGLAGH